MISQHISRRLALIIILSGFVQQTFADNTNVTINNGSQSEPQQNCQNNQSSNQNENTGGVYYKSNPNGGTDTVYTTGNKQPYIVDNNCNNTPIVQPYVYAPGPWGGGGRHR